MRRITPTASTSVTCSPAIVSDSPGPAGPGLVSAPGPHGDVRTQKHRRAGRRRRPHRRHMLLRRPARLHRPPVRAGGAGSRRARRRSWLGRALAATAACQLIFADPDNGIRPAGHREPSHRAKAVKHASRRARCLRPAWPVARRLPPCRSQRERRSAGRRGLADLTRGVPVQPVAAVRACPRLQSALPHRRRLGGSLPLPDRPAHRLPARPMGRGTHRILARLTSDVTGTARDVAFNGIQNSHFCEPFPRAGAQPISAPAAAPAARSAAGPPASYCYHCPQDVLSGCVWDTKPALPHQEDVPTTSASR
jgi:hypothetical protein